MIKHNIKGANKGVLPVVCAFPMGAKSLRTPLRKGLRRVPNAVAAFSSCGASPWKLGLRLLEEMQRQRLQPNEANSSVTETGG